MANCKCTGSTCGCSVTAGSGVGVAGTGTAANPFVISIDTSTFHLGDAVRAADTGTIELSATGTGATGDPVILAGDLVIKSPNGTRWTLNVSNAGVVTAVAAAAPRAGAGSGGTI